MLVAACASVPPAGVPRENSLAPRVDAILERRGLGPDALRVIDNVLRHDGAPPAAAPLVVRELLANPLAAADAATLFDRTVPGTLRRFVTGISRDLAPPLDPGSAPIPLADLLDPYLSELAEAQRLLRIAMRGRAFDARALASQLQDNLPSVNRLEGVAARFDPVLLRRATARFLDATARFARALREGASRIEFPEEGARFESAVGAVVIGTRGNDLHGPSAAVIIDPGGNDTYTRMPALNGAVSVIVDLGGDDRYHGSDVAVHGLSAIVDFSGDDDYDMAGPGLGAAIAGASVIVDFSGNDRYSAEVFGEGAAAFGLGAIVDFAGNDVYRLRAGGQGLGLAEGVGLLWDQGGNDVYSAAGLADVYGRGGGLSWAQGAAFGYRTALGGGIGILRDDAGDDRYEAELYAQGAGYYYALGFLWDRGGADRYRAVRYGQGAGVHEAVGMLRDESGDDRYTLDVGVGQGMGLDLAVGVLFDAVGDDRYEAPLLAQGTATANGIGLVFDGAGADRWRVEDTRQAWGRAEWARGLPSLGLLLYETTRAVFAGGDGTMSPPADAAQFGGPFGDAPVRHEPAAVARCPETTGPVVGKMGSDPFSLAESLRRLAPAFAGGKFDSALYADVQRRLTAQLGESLAVLPQGDFDVMWSLGEALRCAAAGASAADLQAMWDAMERMLVANPGTPFAGAMAGALRERTPPQPQLERILAAFDTSPGCGVRATALQLRGAATADAASRVSAARAAQIAVQSACWRQQASALAVLKQLGAPPADRAALPSFLRSAF